MHLGRIFGIKTLPAPSQPSAILSFDFDGTLHDPAHDPPVPASFFQTIRRLRNQQQVIWGINTGRSLQQMLEGFRESKFAFLPDWIVAREREIYFPGALGRWRPHHPWNQNCEEEIHALFKRIRKLLAHIRHEIEEHTGARWLEMDGEPAGLISQSEDEMAWIVSHITPLVASEPHLSWQRNSIYLRFGHRDFHKGSSLTEISRIYQVPTSRCFAMGDSHNDLEMLDPIHAGMRACPANSVSEIRKKMRETGGLVTQLSRGPGAIEALNHYFPSQNSHQSSSKSII